MDGSGGDLFDGGNKRRQRHALMARGGGDDGGGNLSSSSSALKYGSPPSRGHHHRDVAATKVLVPSATPCAVDGDANGARVAFKKNGLFSRSAAAPAESAARGKEAPGRGGPQQQHQHVAGSKKGWLDLEPERDGTGVRQQHDDGDGDCVFTWGTGEMNQDLLDAFDDFGGDAFVDNDRAKEKRGGLKTARRTDHSTSITPFEKWKRDRGIFSLGVANALDNMVGYDLWGS